MRCFLLSMVADAKVFLSHFSVLLYVPDDLLSAKQGKQILSLSLHFTFLLCIYLVEDVYTVCWIILPLHKENYTLVQVRSNW